MFSFSMKFNRYTGFSTFASIINVLFLTLLLVSNTSLPFSSHTGKTSDSDLLSYLTLNFSHISWLNFLFVIYGWNDWYVSSILSSNTLTSFFLFITIGCRSISLSLSLNSNLSYNHFLASLRSISKQCATNESIPPLEPQAKQCQMPSSLI